MKAALIPEPSNVSNESVNMPKKRSLKHIKSRRKMSNLEKLPTELMVEIFFHSMNIDLPRSSPVIAGKLTSELVYIRTVIEVFGPTWKEGYGNYKSARANSYFYEEYQISGFPPEQISKDIVVSDAELQVRNCISEV